MRLRRGWGRLPGVRHLRYFYWRGRLDRWWRTVGYRFWSAPNPEDTDWLEQIWQGKA